MSEYRVADLNMVQTGLTVKSHDKSFDLNCIQYNCVLKHIILYIIVYSFRVCVAERVV